EMRFAHEVQILGEEFEPDSDCSHIYVSDGAVVYLPPGSGEGDEQILFEDISGEVTFSLAFAESDEGEDILFFRITAGQGDAEYQLTTEVLLLNAAEIILDPEGEMEDGVGCGVRYVSPMPPPPMIQTVLLTDPGSGQILQGQVEGEEVDVRLVVNTVRVENGTPVTVLVLEGEEDEVGVADVTISPGNLDAEGYCYGNRSIFDNSAEFTITFGEEVPPGTYKVQVWVEGVDEPMTRAYVVMPWGGLEAAAGGPVSDPDDELIFTLQVLGWRLVPEHAISLRDWTQVESWTVAGALAEDDFSVSCDQAGIEIQHSYAYDPHLDAMVLTLYSEDALQEDATVTVAVTGQEWVIAAGSQICSLQARRSDTGLGCEFDVFLDE
ncbi:MAG: hypothetical protein R6U70_03130, partial [Bacillota bacterium]